MLGEEGVISTIRARAPVVEGACACVLYGLKADHCVTTKGEHAVVAATVKG